MALENLGNSGNFFLLLCSHPVKISMHAGSLLDLPVMV